MIIVQGPMWAGKTTYLLNEVNKYKTSEVVAFDCCNTRNTLRDLHNLVPCYNLTDEIDFSDSIRLVVFDEVHLINVFNKEEIFLGQVEKALQHNKEIIMAGLLYDYYTDYEWFPIWEIILNKWNKRIKYVWLQSLRPCCDCGRKDSSVIYTKKLDDKEDRVGDNYGNVCLSCVMAKRSPLNGKLIKIA